MKKLLTGFLFSILIFLIVACQKEVVREVTPNLPWQDNLLKANYYQISRRNIFKDEDEEPKQKMIAVLKELKFAEFLNLDDDTKQKDFKLYLVFFKDAFSDETKEFLLAQLKKYDAEGFFLIIDSNNKYIRYQSKDDSLLEDGYYTIAEKKLYYSAFKEYQPEDKDVISVPIKDNYVIVNEKEDEDNKEVINNDQGQRKEDKKRDDDYDDKEDDDKGNEGRDIYDNLDYCRDRGCKLLSGTTTVSIPYSSVQQRFWTISGTLEDIVAQYHRTIDKNGHYSKIRAYYYGSKETTVIDDLCRYEYQVATEIDPTKYNCSKEGLEDILERSRTVPESYTVYYYKDYKSTLEDFINKLDGGNGKYWKYGSEMKTNHVRYCDLSDIECLSEDLPEPEADY